MYTLEYESTSAFTLLAKLNAVLQQGLTPRPVCNFASLSREGARTVVNLTKG